MYGLFHARKLRAHELALRLGWDTLHPRARPDEPLLRLVHAGDLRRRTSRCRPIGQARTRARRWTSSPCAGCAVLAGRGAANAGGQADGGALAIVLHTHMPYVEGFGTWPFGEEWLWEAIAGSYLPLLELLDAGAPLTLSLTPVLCDQLEAPGVRERFDDVRRGGAPPHARGGRRRPARRRARAARTRGRALVGRLRARAASAVRTRRRPARRARPARAVDLLGDARRAAAARHRRRRAPAGAGRYRLPPRALRRRPEAQAGAAASGCPSAPMHGAWRRCSQTPACVRRASS